MTAEYVTRRSPTFSSIIFIAGDYKVAKQICREYCDEVGLCVTIEPTTYIYTGGIEEGVRIGLINYPRFPTTEVKLFAAAVALGHRLLTGLHQTSFTVQGPYETIYISIRKEDKTLAT